MSKIDIPKIKGLIVEMEVKIWRLVELTDEVKEQVFRHAWKEQREWQEGDGKNEHAKHHLTEDQCREKTTQDFSVCFRRWADSESYFEWAESKPEDWQPGPVIKQEENQWESFCHVLHEGEDVPEKLTQWFDY
jgi:hypothetical protein